MLSDDIKNAGEVKTLVYCYVNNVNLLVTYAGQNSYRIEVHDQNIRPLHFFVDGAYIDAFCIYTEDC